MFEKEGIDNSRALVLVLACSINVSCYRNFISSQVSFPPTGFSESILFVGLSVIFYTLVGDAFGEAFGESSQF